MKRFVHIVAPWLICLAVILGWFGALMQAREGSGSITWMLGVGILSAVYYMGRPKQ